MSRATNVIHEILEIFSKSMATPIGHEFERERICESFDT